MSTRNDKNNPYDSGLAVEKLHLKSKNSLPTEMVE